MSLPILPMNRALLCLAFAACACNPLPKTPDEEEQAAARARAAAAKPTATPRKPGDWMYDNHQDRLGIKDKDQKGNYVSPLSGGAKGTPKKDDKYVNPLDKKPAR